MIDQDITNYCKICKNINLDNTEYHKECYDDLKNNNFKDTIIHIGNYCFICNKIIQYNDPYCYYEKNNFVKFHLKCMQTWHSNSNIRYDEGIFGIDYSSVVDFYYTNIDNITTKVLLNIDHSINIDYEYNNEIMQEFEIYKSNNSNGILYTITLIIVFLIAILLIFYVLSYF